MTNITPVLTPIGRRGLAIAIASIALLLFVDITQRYESLRNYLGNIPRLLRYPALATLIVGILLCGIFKEEPFLYFQF